MTDTVLVINSGSSSIKYQLVNPDNGDAIAKGLVERIGESEGHIQHKYGEKVVDVNEPIADHEVGMREVLRLFDEVGGPALITDEVRDLIDELCALAPLHNPAHLKGIDVARELMPDTPHVAVFDTAFFQRLPEETATYALKQEVAEKYAVRRYGAHGTSHQYVSGQVARLMGNDALRQIVLHLGNGASVSAVKAGRPIDTSMGLTPLEGLVMGTRTGDIDPAVVFHLQRQTGWSADEVDDLFNKQSGLKGLTGENDMRAVRHMVDSEDPEVARRARLALDIYVTRIIKYIGSYTAELGGLDVITFTAGIGENDADLRREVCERLLPFGVRIDDEINNQRFSAPTTISTNDSSIAVMVVPTNEELAIARQALTLI